MIFVEIERLFLDMKDIVIIGEFVFEDRIRGDRCESRFDKFQNDFTVFIGS